MDELTFGPGVHSHHGYAPETPGHAEFNAWGGIHTFVTGELVTAAVMNTYVSNNLQYLKGGAGTIVLDDSIRLPNNKYLLGLDSDTVSLRNLIGISPGDVLNVGVDAGFSTVQVGYGQIVYLLHSTGNAMVEFDPNGGGAGIPQFVLYRSEAQRDFMVEGGSVYFNNVKQLIWRNAADTAWLSAVYVDAANNLNLAADDAIAAIQLFGLTSFYDDAATPALLAAVDPAAGLLSQGRRVHTHPYANHRHIESGTASVVASATVTVTFTDAFAVAPVMTLGWTAGASGADKPYINTGPSTTGATIATTGSVAYTLHWIAEGQD